MSTPPRPPNRLARERSPYLLQHAHNPVDWHPWGPEALALARDQDRPIFLSVGYSACHWCHVMAHESFEDEAIAAVMNALYVNIKVDREERPDVDHLYMSILVAQSGHGGWPLSVWLSPQLEPYFAGTYFPPYARRGQPGFADALRSLERAYRERKDEARSQGAMVLDWARRSMRGGEPGEVDPAWIDLAYDGYRAAFDRVHGGFGGAPKFPRPMCLSLLLRHHARSGNRDALDMATRTLAGMASGGMYDQLGGGFARYSVDARWLVPHFEKMLYDNALLASCYLEAYSATRDPLHARIAREVLGYLGERMTAPGGGCFAAEDADSEGEEGKYYVWTPAEIAAALGNDEDVRLACAHYGVSAEGNFEHSGRSVLVRAREPADLAPELGLDVAAVEARLAAIRTRLLAARDLRVRPGTDDKILAGWNGLAAAALARAAWILDEPAYAERARRALAFVEREMAAAGGGLVRAWRDGPAAIPAMLDDYAFHAAALLELYHATAEPALVARAVEIAELVLARFADPASGALFQTEAAGELPVRTMDLQDNALPSGNSAMAGVLWRLARLTRRADFEAASERLLAAHAPLLARAPHALPQMLCVLADRCFPPAELVVIGSHADPRTRALVDHVRRRYLPATVLARAEPETLDEARRFVPLLDGKALTGQLPTAYLCRDGACELPTTDPAAWGRQLDAYARGP